MHNIILFNEKMRKFKKGLNWRSYFTFLTLFLTVFGLFQPLVAQSAIDRQLSRTEPLEGLEDLEDIFADPYLPDQEKVKIDPIGKIDLNNFDPKIVEFSQALVKEIIANPETTKKILPSQSN